MFDFFFRKTREKGGDRDPLANNNRGGLAELIRTIVILAVAALLLPLAQADAARLTRTSVLDIVCKGTGPYIGGGYFKWKGVILRIWPNRNEAARVGWVSTRASYRASDGSVIPQQNFQYYFDSPKPLIVIRHDDHFSWLMKRYSLPTRASEHFIYNQREAKVFRRITHGFALPGSGGESPAMKRRYEECRRLEENGRLD